MRYLNRAGLQDGVGMALASLAQRGLGCQLSRQASRWGPASLQDSGWWALTSASPALGLCTLGKGCLRATVSCDW